MTETGRPSSAALLHPAGSKNPTEYEATATPEDVTLRAAPYAVDPDAVVVGCPDQDYLASMTFNFGIPGYQPDWRHGISDIASRHAQRLRGLVGRRLTSTWVVWDDDDDSWFADCPMVLDFDEERLEINHQKFDDISITWCTIDVTRAPLWPTSDGFRLRWRDDAPASLAARHGQRLTEVELLEYVGGDMADGSVALGLRFADDWLTIYNALDENGIEVGEISPQYRRHRPS